MDMKESGVRSQESGVRIGVLAALVALAMGMVAVAQDAPRESKRELLSWHETVAKYEGTRFQPCRHLTSLCPDRCGHARTLATFRIVRYLRYEKPGEYGDPKAEQFHVPVTGPQASNEADPRWDAVVKLLKPGDLVRLDWRHEYVTRDGSSFPERPVTRMEKITAVDAAKAGDEAAEAGKDKNASSTSTSTSTSKMVSTNVRRDCGLE
jgi:hypothetical protein